MVSLHAVGVFIIGVICLAASAFAPSGAQGLLMIIGGFAIGAGFVMGLVDYQSRR